MKLNFHIQNNDGCVTWVFAPDSQMMNHFGPPLVQAHDELKYIQNPMLIFPIFQKMTAEIADGVYLINPAKIPEDSEPVFLVNDLFFQKCIPSNEPSINKILDTKLLNNGKNIINFYMKHGLHCFGVHFAIETLYLQK